ncbi:hypothetical protein LPJ66_011949, partial [Kickxella alabastrina]
MLLEYGFVLARNPFQVLELDDAVSAWVAAAEARLLAARPAAALMRPDGLRRLVDTLRQRGLWGDFTISLDDLEPSYRLQAALRLLLAAEQRGATAKGAIARWDRWRRGGPTADAEGAEDAAVRAWVEAACARLAAEAERMLVGTAAASLAQPGVPGVDAFLVRCLHTVWLEISAIATRCCRADEVTQAPCINQMLSFAHRSILAASFKIPLGGSLAPAIRPASATRLLHSSRALSEDATDKDAPNADESKQTLPQKASNIVRTILHGSEQVRQETRDTLSKVLARGKYVHELATHR